MGIRTGPIDGLRAGAQTRLGSCRQRTNERTNDTMRKLTWEKFARESGHLYILNSVRCLYVRPYVRNGGRGQPCSEWRHNDNDVIMRTGAASAASPVGARRHNDNDDTMTIAGLWTYGDWRHVATGCTALVHTKFVSHHFQVSVKYLWTVG